MPIYEYKCTKCGNALEVMAKVNDPAPAKCEKCGAENTFERLVSRTNFQLKGGGWYSDLYASTKKEGTASTTTSPSGGEGGSTTATAAPASGAAAAPSTSSAPAAGGASGSSGSGSSGSGSSGSGSSST